MSIFTTFLYVLDNLICIFLFASKYNAWSGFRAPASKLDSILGINFTQTY